MSIRFIWDDEKAEINRQKHGVSFVEAAEIFADPRSVSYADDLHSAVEERLITMGLSKKLRVLLVVHTEVVGVDADVIIRIISARRATPLERATYEKA